MFDLEAAIALSLEEAEKGADDSSNDDSSGNDDTPNMVPGLITAESQNNDSAPKIKRSRTGRKNNHNNKKRPPGYLPNLHVAQSEAFQATDFSGPDAAHAASGYQGLKDKGKAYDFLKGRSYEEQKELLEERGYTFLDPDPRYVVINTLVFENGHANFLRRFIPALTTLSSTEQGGSLPSVREYQTGIGRWRS